MEGIPEDDLKDHERSKGNDFRPQTESKPSPVVSTSTSAPLIPIPGVVSPPMPGVLQMPSLPFGLPQANQQFANFAANLPPPPTSLPQMFGAAIPPPPSLVAHTMMGGGRHMAHHLPNKPLFPSVSSASTTTQSSVVGTDFRPLGFAPNSGPNNSFMSQNTNSSNATVSASAIISKPASSATIATAGATSKIVHPEEDISLEELRARQPRYKMVIPPQTHQSMNGLNPNSAVYTTPSGPPPPLPPNLGLPPPPPQGLLPNPIHPSFQSTFRPAF